jgi:hypothetical protein
MSSSVSPWPTAAKNRRASSSRRRRMASNRGFLAWTCRRARRAICRQLASLLPTTAAICS